MENILLVLVLSLDAFMASIAYGTNKIKMPFKSILIIDMVCAIFLALSIFFGIQIRKILPESIALILGATILILLGIYYLFESIFKSYLENKLKENEKVKIKLFDIWFVIDVYVDETKADFNLSKNLDSKEALYLATALSLDSLAVGFGSSLGNINYLQVIGLSLVIGMFSIWSGLFIGKKIVEKTKINLSWLSGIILIILGLLKLI
ncbi:sporulation membrane protein YtaF [Tissierella praeacuta]|uniref:Putative sporulation protein YtaF n=1 Tax=Tissierella praeacuta DSM 18095 TaxID=1123404 RepID=A0A1M4TGV5_9FIRM|nr:sporulation membrane protein YtaF [Tissierella praeacuta]HAE92604.1 sporulation membrane protein YtaF [Tissierella sp.]MBU5256946.1 sporulation membrane protein YtaF [Tissierella praeacuta]TCU77527.1 putative sporulation protein YtaF [Tissierella praeacuta]SHE43648.1 putative sporulation protein YtaF [Tissierella praeacuta DSM 18095]SUP04646.1 putative sporulation protein YtaF [Tissierella praeacuta]